MTFFDKTSKNKLNLVHDFNAFNDFLWFEKIF